MNLTDVDLLYWTAGFCGHSALLLVIWKRHRAREFPIFTAWIASNVVRTVVLAALVHRAGRMTYYYTYWSLAVIDAALQFGIVYEMYSLTFRPLGVWARDVRKAFKWLFASSLVIAGLLASMAKPHPRFWVEQAVIWGNLFSSAWMSELFVGMSVICLRVGLPWKAHVARISQGLGVYSMLGVAIAAGNAYFGLKHNSGEYTALSHLRMSIYLCCLLYWVLMLWKPAPDTKAMSLKLHQQLARLQGRAERDLQTIRIWGRR